MNEKTETYFADVILPLPLDRTFTYRVPRDFQDILEPGMAVVVPFGSKKVVTGIIQKITYQPPKEYEAKLLFDYLIDMPLVKPVQLAFFKWMAEYYMCTIGEVIQAAIPSAFKLSSQSKISLKPGFERLESSFPFSSNEEKLLNVLEYQDSITYPEIEEVLKIKTIQPIIKSLISKEAVYLFEEIKEKYKPKTVTKIRIRKDQSDKIQEWFEALEKKTKQQEVLIAFCSKTKVLHDPQKNTEGISKQELLDGALSASSLKTLIKNGLFEEFTKIVSRFDEAHSGIVSSSPLSEKQRQAEEEILRSFEYRDIILLHGVTGSGKTNIYMELIRKSIENGGQVLYLLPEIALTTQITRKLKAVFGNRVGIYHSRFSDNERAELWKGLLDSEFDLIIGVRSAIFLPFENLSLIIVDEEHEPSYKQYDPAPRYQARDSALMLGKMHHAKIILGTATPSVETYYNAKTDKYGYVSLKERYGQAKLPTIQIASLKGLKGPGSEFSSLFTDKIKQALDKKEQVIVFQNRRGYAHYITCEVCGWIPESPNCNIKLTYHQARNELRCHYSGYREKLPPRCPVCGSGELKMVGLGTEQLEEKLKLTFPNALIQRMDLDTTRSKYAFQRIIEDFEDHKIDMLIGTQMVTKGLDFEDVSTVGIFDADRMLYYPDFRSHERTFQLLMQVSGRAGRSKKEGIVVIQTHQPDHGLFQRVIQHDYEAQYRVEIEGRQQYIFPPFCRLIKVSFKHENVKISEEVSQEIAAVLRKQLGNIRVMGPQQPLLFFIRGLYVQDLYIKILRPNDNIKKIKELIQQEIITLKKQKAYKQVKIILDVDPA